MTFDSSALSSHPAAIAIFSNSQTDASKKFSGPLTEVLGQPYSSHHLNDDEDVALSPLVLIDCHCYSARRIQSWLTVKSADHLPPVGLYNARAGSRHESLLEWPCVRGFFYRNSERRLLVDGLRSLLEGDYWVPRRLLHAYLERNRRNPMYQITTPRLLTDRERQILAMLENGATNAAIAEAISLSEHTIKTHLYNVYRKIGVANRVEACNWARQNLKADLLY